MYVDDILSGAESPQETQRNANQLVDMLKAGGFHLQKWASNDRSILNIVDPDISTESARPLPTPARTLGLTWCPINDAFTFNFNLTDLDDSNVITKRTVLSRAAQLFDPLGWLAPVVIRGKIFIQRLWKSQIGWDDPLPPSLARDWIIFNENFKTLSSLSIPRWIGSSSSISGAEFHGFSDVSQEAFGAVLYFRTMREFDDVRIVLLTAKSKVAPVKRQTIPRLELSAAVLLARLLVRIRNILNLNHIPAYLWTDSTITLAWIRGHPANWKEFISNRVAVIQDLTPDARWCHVAGVDNPADSADEILRARTFWLKATQLEHFPHELDLCVRKSTLPRSHPLLKLSPFVDHEGILRVGGRLKNSLLDPDIKHSAILPRNSPLSTLIISDVHNRTLHGGVQTVLSIIRQQFWIIGGRSPVSAFIRRYVRCIRQRAETAHEMMGSLPTFRVNPSRAFSHSGVDYAGPFTLRNWRGRSSRNYKGYLVVFVCFATSAVHLELSTDYSTQGFIAAYRRFISRRGRCVSIRSDCGTNLVGADAELRRMFSSASKESKKIAHFLSADGTDWNFNPPSAPHFGGKWEAAVKSTKFHLRCVLGDSVLTYEEFHTLLVQIEAVLNSRPLCAHSDDPSDVNALTPAHFLIGESLITLPEPFVVEIPVSRLSRWQLIRQMLEQFWHRWSTEYLQRLQPRQKWNQSANSLSLGSLVLILDERFPPSKWPLARVTALHPGNDGRVRVVTVQTAASEFKRPIVKLCSLPIQP